ncbi:MAG: glutamate synthase [Phycisphaerae bacterium]
MSELHPAPFTDLVERIHLEFARQRAVFDFPQDKWFVPDPSGPDLSVRLHGRLAANPLGPAAGPHTQMAQNIVLGWLAGARIFELKTVQRNDRLRIPRPCIDVADAGYNVEWSQELRLEESLTQYVAAAMLIHMVRHGPFFEDVDLRGDLGATLYDLSLGYDLAGIRSERIRWFIDRMKSAGETIDRLRLQIPSRDNRLRDLDYPENLVTGATLSTFHGCPADEIERIGEFLVTEMDLDIVIKMNPPMLGKERLEHLLHDVLGYREAVVNPAAYEAGLRFDEAVALCRRLTDLARRHGRSVGAKFSNTLEVLNRRGVLPGDVIYLSGPPLHVITLTLADLFRQHIGSEFPISFSAGVDRHNFAAIVACGFCPVTTCTDLLKTGGYGRLPAYLRALSAKMTEANAATIDEYIRGARGMADRAGRLAEADGDTSPRHIARIAGMLNTAVIAEEARRDPRYRAGSNRGEPRRTGSRLELFDCLTCEKCVSVCPNDANFIYPTPPQTLICYDILVHPDGTFRTDDLPRDFAVKQAEQIANFADFCNECGNCDTFCPEYGGPFIRKPSFFGSMETWARHADRDGFHVERDGPVDRIVGRMQGRRYRLERHRNAGLFRFEDDAIAATIPVSSSTPREVVWLVPPPAVPHRIDMRVFHTLRVLLAGILTPERVNQANIRAWSDPICENPKR